MIPGQNPCNHDHLGQLYIEVVRRYMNDPQWFNKETSYFDQLLTLWKDEHHKSDMYQNML